MARYNSKRIYNRLIPNGGARYNSAPFSINIFDYSNVIIDNIKNVTRNTSIQDSNTTRTESITFGFNVNIYDDIVILEKTVLLIDTGTRIDLGHGQETINNQSNSNYSDTGRGNDNINLSPLMLLLNELSKHTDNINIHPLTIALSQILNINETINFDTVLLEFIDNINSSENTLFDSNINIEDNSQGSDNLSRIISNILTNELGNGVEVINLLPLSINITDNNLTANETVNINSVIIYNDSGNGIDSVTYRLGAFYNTKLSYNKGYNKGGANYNTSKQFVIMLFERGMMAIEAKVTPDKISMEDSSIGNDTMLPISSMSPISELINVQEGFVLFPHMITIDESGHISISTDIRLSVSFNDSSISTADSTLLDVDVNALDEIVGIFQDILSLPLMQVSTSDNLSLADLINIELSDINLIDNVLINEFANISNDIFLNDENISAIDIVVYRSGVFYNTKLQYNKGINKGGNIYNSSKHLIIVVSEIGSIDEKEVYVVQACFVNDTGQGNDNSNITNEIPKMFDSGISADSFKNIVNNVTVIDLSKLDFNEFTKISNDILLNDENISAIDIVVYRSFYNTKLQYNKGINKGGSIYNSSKHLIIVVSESGNVDEKEAYVVQACFVYDTGQGDDNIDLSSLIVCINDLIQGTDNINIHPLTIALSQTININDLIGFDFVSINFIDTIKTVENALLNSSIDIKDNAQSNDVLIQIISNILTNELGDGIEAINILPLLLNMNDSNLLTNEATNINSVVIYSDNGNITDILSLPLIQVNTNENISLVDLINVELSDINLVDNTSIQEETMFARLVDVIDKIVANDHIILAETYFMVDADNILQPLGIKVAKVSEGILPFTKDYTEEIPGMHGEYYLKSELKGKAIEFEVITPDGLTPEVKNELKRKVAEYLNPTKNVEKPLTFSDDLEKQYLVRYSGNIDIDNYPSWFKFVIPFKMSNPLIRGSFDNILIGSGTITNEGNTNANMIININGLATNPTIELDGQILTYNGTIEYGQTVVIDTEKKTVMMGDINVLNNWCGIFPTLKPGNTNVIMNGNISIRWRNAWL